MLRPHPRSQAPPRAPPNPGPCSLGPSIGNAYLGKTVRVKKGALGTDLLPTALRVSGIVLAST